MATFKGFWHGPPLGLLRSACLNSFISKGHRFHLYTYQQYEDIPSGVELKDANSIIKEEDILWYHNPISGSKKDLGPFSDLFRFKLLNEQGGWWSDTDAICLRSDISDLQEAWCQEHPKWYSDSVGTSQLCLQKGGILATELYRRAQEVSKAPLEKRESLGPLLLGQTIFDLGLEKDHNADASLFYPYTWLEMFKLWLPEYCQEIASKTSSSLFLPIYQSMPTYAGLDLLHLPPKGSYLYEFLNANRGKYSLDSYEIYEAQDVRNAFKKYFEDNYNWAVAQIEDLCGPEITATLNIKPPRVGLITRIKQRLRGILGKFRSGVLATI
jgi:hypothetical protein